MNLKTFPLFLTFLQNQPVRGKAAKNFKSNKENYCRVFRPQFQCNPWKVSCSALIIVSVCCQLQLPAMCHVTIQSVSRTRYISLHFPCTLLTKLHTIDNLLHQLHHSDLRPAPHHCVRCSSWCVLCTLQLHHLPRAQNGCVSFPAWKLISLFELNFPTSGLEMGVRSISPDVKFWIE